MNITQPYRLNAKRSDLVLPEESAPGINYVLLRLEEPKTRGRSARHQAARIEPRDLVLLISAVFGSLNPSEKLWKMSSATLRKRVFTAAEWPWNPAPEGAGSKGLRFSQS